MCSWLPYKQRIKKLVKIFSTAKHGYSLRGMYSRCRDCGPCFVLILASPESGRTSPNPKSVGSPQKQMKVPKLCTIGVYLGTSFDNSYKFIGTNDSFLFSLSPVEAVYKHSKKNDYFAMGKEDSLTFGAEG